MTVERVTTVNGIAALRPLYDRLNRLNGNTLPFALHEWHLTWCRHFLNCDPRVHDEPLFFVLRDPSEACVAIVPLVVSRRRLGPLKISVHQSARSRSGHHRDPHSSDRARLRSADRSRREGRSSKTSRTGIGFIGPESATSSQRRFAVDRRRSAVAAAPGGLCARFASDWEEFRAGLKRNIRESLRHCYNSLKRDNLGFRADR